MCYLFLLLFAWTRINNCTSWSAWMYGLWPESCDIPHSRVGGGGRKKDRHFDVGKLWKGTFEFSNQQKIIKRYWILFWSLWISIGRHIYLIFTYRPNDLVRMNWLFWHLLPPGMTFIDLIRLVAGWWKWWEKWLVSVLSTHLYLYLSFSLYMYISVYLSFYVSIFLFIYLSNYLSIYISVFLSSLLVKKNQTHLSSSEFAFLFLLDIK